MLYNDSRIQSRTIHRTFIKFLSRDNIRNLSLEQILGTTKKNIIFVKDLTVMQFELVFIRIYSIKN